VSEERPRVLLLRLNKESWRKCSLAGLRGRPELGLEWLHCALGQEVEVGEVTLLHPEGTPLGPEDAARPLLLVDSSWRDLPRVLRGVRGVLHRRRLPAGLQTAYPRRSSLFQDPGSGLATLEALDAALCLLGHRDDRILEGYRWAEEWRRRNHALLLGGKDPEGGP